MIPKNGLANNLQGVPEITGNGILLKPVTGLIVIRERTA